MHQPPEIPQSQDTEFPLWIPLTRMVLGGLLLLFGLYSLITYIYGLYQLHTVSFLKTDFFFRYMLGSHYTVILAIFSLAGGVGLLLKQRFGWIFAMASTVLNLVLLGVSILYYNMLSGLELASGLFLFVNIAVQIMHFAMIVYLLLPWARKELKVKGIQWGLATGLTFILLLDYLFSTLILAPEF